jgi:hypothetical protein
VNLITFDPLKETYDPDDAVTFTPFQDSGTAPLTYEWFVNGESRSTDRVFAYTVLETDIVNKDESGLGFIHVWVVVKNACNTDGASTSHFNGIQAQGSP